MTTTDRSWRVPGKIPAGKVTIAVLVAAVALPGLIARGEWWQYGVAAAAVVGLLGWAARDLVAPVRLAADAAGLTVVTGFATRHRLAWDRVERVRVDTRRRSQMLEIDVGDHLYLFSRYDLNADLDDVVEELLALKAAARP